MKLGWVGTEEALKNTVEQIMNKQRTANFW